MSLQGGTDAAPKSPGYTKWLGSPNSHSNEDFESWGSFRNRASSDASTLSGRRSPFLPEEDVSDGAEMHLGYQGAKLPTKLPSLSEVSGTFCGKSMMMENLLDNLNLLSPKNGVQEGPGAHFAPYASGQDFHKWQGGIGVPMQAVSESKPGVYHPYAGQFNCPTGLLKELLGNGAEPRGNMLPPVEGLGHQGVQLLPPYSSEGHTGTAVLPLGHLGRHANVKPYMHFPQHLASGPGGDVDPPPPLAYCVVNSNSYHRQPPVHPHQHHHNHLERLPSDLDDMAIERLECDVESVLHDTLMDGDALDFNFEHQHVFVHSHPHAVIKGNTPSWVSG